MASTTENNQIYGRSVLQDHKIIIDGVQYHEKMELVLERNSSQFPDGRKTLSHLRSIGDQTYTINYIIVDGEVNDETIETTLAEDEIANFKKDWNENSRLKGALIDLEILRLSSFLSSLVNDSQAS